MNDEIFESEIRSAGDLAGVFEYGGETGYFNLYKISSVEGRKIVDAIRILSGAPDFAASDVKVRWDAFEQKVGLLIRGNLWAVSDAASRQKYGGNDKASEIPNLPYGRNFL